MKKSKKTRQNLASKQYNPATIEPIWQSKWEKEGIYHSDLDSANGSASSPLGPFYNLMMFPYPSAEGMHAGNFFAFTGADTYGRFKKMQGYDVFEPIGLDGFGIHSENYAIKVGSHPVKQSKKSEENFYRQFRLTGNMFDYTRTVETYKPDYYKWTQWVFTELFKSGLATRKKSPVNFCPSCKTVLADEQVIDGKCERCSSVVEKKNLEQWFFKITEYADRLLKNIDGLDWTEKVKTAQRNWIGRSEGAKIKFSLKDISGQNDSKHFFEIFTTAIDTIYGVTFMVVSPEVAKSWLEVGWKAPSGVVAYIDRALNRDLREREADDKSKTGVDTGIVAVNPFNDEEIPVWVADYVLGSYGTGAIMAVPAHDARDYEFARKFGLPIKPVVRPKDNRSEAAVGKDGFWDYPEIKTKYAEKSELFDSGEFSGLTSRDAKEKMLDQIEEKGYGKREATYHLRDWLISRQRYWGPPIPMVYCSKCAGEGKSWFTSSEHSENSANQNIRRSEKSESQTHRSSESSEFSEMRGWYPVPEENLPVELPYVEDFKPFDSPSAGSGQNAQGDAAVAKGPLANHPEFYEVKCPQCGASARRETDVSDTFLDSSWYFLRYLATDWDNLPFPSKLFIAEHSEYSVSQKIRKSDNSENQTNRSSESSEFSEIENRLRFLPVNMYIGGAEHSVLHLLYARFITMVFKDLGLIEFEEPFARFYAHGLIIKEGAKMSKSKGNIVNPDEYIKKYGTDTMRMYLRFLAPFDQSGDFRDSGIEGMHRFLKRVWKLFQKDGISNLKSQISNERLREMHKTIKAVTDEMEGLRFNTAIAYLMTWYNFLSKQKELSLQEVENYLKLLAPFAPYMAEELWQQLRLSGLGSQLSVSGQPVSRSAGKQTTGKQLAENRKQKTYNWSIHTQSWPTYDEKYLVADTVKIPVQVNGKLRGTLEVATADSTDQEKIEKLARADENVSKFLEGKAVKKAIFIKGKILNFVI